MIPLTLLTPLPRAAQMAKWGLNLLNPYYYSSAAVLFSTSLFPRDNLKETRLE